MWFLARMYNAQQALQMGLVNTVVPLDRLETETLVWYVLFSYNYNHNCDSLLTISKLRPLSGLVYS